MPGSVFQVNLKIFAKTIVLHTNLQVFILLIKMFSRALLANDFSQCTDFSTIVKATRIFLRKGC